MAISKEEFIQRWKPKIGGNFDLRGSEGDWRLEDTGGTGISWEFDYILNDHGYDCVTSVIRAVCNDCPLVKSCQPDVTIVYPIGSAEPVVVGNSVNDERCRLTSRNGQ